VRHGALALGALVASMLPGCAARQPAAPAAPPTEVVFDIAPQGRYVFSSALMEDDLYFSLVTLPSGEGEIWAAGSTSGSYAPVIEGQTFPANLAVFDDLLYWNTSTTREAGAPGAIHRWSPAERVVHTVAEGEPFPSDLVITRAGIYWSSEAGCLEEPGDDPRRRGAGTIRFLAPDAAAPCTLASGLCVIHAMAVGTDGVHWVTTVPPYEDAQDVPVYHGMQPFEDPPTADPGTLVTGSRAAVTVGERTFWSAWTAVMVSGPGEEDGQPFIDGVDRPGHLATDGTYLYWVQGTFSYGFTLMRAPLAGGPPMRLAAETSATVGLHIDDEHIHWVVFGGRWHRIPR
jgi:hypothetical protein